VFPAPWRYAGRTTGGETWCLGVSGGTLTLTGTPTDETLPDVFALAEVLAAEPDAVNASAAPWRDPQAPARRPGYALVTHVTYRQWMAAYPDDIPTGLTRTRVEVLGGGGGGQSSGATGRGALVFEHHSFQRLGLAFELRAGTMFDLDMGGADLAARGLAGAGIEPLPWLAVGGYAGLGVSGVAHHLPAALELPVEALVLVGRSNVGLELLVRGSFLLTSRERRRLPAALGPFDDTYARAAVWIASLSEDDRSGYADYGTRALWLGIASLDEGGARWVGGTAGLTFAALPIR
jgi:hypothetical protein